MREFFTRCSVALAIAVSSVVLLPAQTAKRSLTLDDLAKIKNVGDPQCAADGKSAPATAPWLRQNNESALSVT